MKPENPYKAKIKTDFDWVASFAWDEGSQATARAIKEALEKYYVELRNGSRILYSSNVQAVFKEYGV